MTRRNVLILALFLCMTLPATAQQKASPGFYLGVQAGVPLFWGDLASIGTTTYPGAAIGIAAGYHLNKWLAAELDADYGAGILGARKWQANDFIDDRGMLQYTKGNWMLGTIYSRTRFVSLGLRLPVRLLTLLHPSKNRTVDLELAPRFAFNHFIPEIFDRHSYRKLTNGVIPQKWAYAAGGDLGVAVKLDSKTQLYLRAALSWLSDERFEGISARPAWRVNLQSYTSLGIRFNINKH